MPCIDISKMLKIEGGVLYAKDDCCNWIAVGAIAGPDASEDIGDTPLDPTEGETPPDYDACGKALAVVDFAYNLVTAAWNERDEFPWQWVSHIETALGENLGDAGVIKVITALDLLAGLNLSLTEITDPWARQSILCKVANVLNTGTADGATEDQYQEIRNIFRSDNLLYRGLWAYVFDAMGWKLTNRLAMMGATNVTGDCDCPDLAFLQSYGPDASGWYLSTPFTDGVQSNDVTEAGDLAVCFANTPTHDAYGVAFKLSWSGATGVIKRMGSTFSPDCNTPAVDNWVWGDTSDQLQQEAQSVWIVCAGNTTIRDIGVALLQAAGQAVHAQSATSNFGTVIATPGVSAAGENMAGVIYTGATGVAALAITEVRWIQNTGSPSHA